jgi:hypothetical protein
MAPTNLPIVYGVRVKENNGDSIHELTTLYSSIDGLMKGLEKQIKDIESYHEDDEEEDYTDDPPVYVNELFYYTGSEVFKNVPVPSKDYIEKILADKRRTYLDGLIIRVGDLHGALSFACEISVLKLVVNP